LVMVLKMSLYTRLQRGFDYDYIDLASKILFKKDNRTGGVKMKFHPPKVLNSETYKVKMFDGGKTGRFSAPISNSVGFRRKYWG
jgi:hypothetical protein